MKNFDFLDQTLTYAEFFCLFPIVLSNPDRINVEMLSRSACCAVQKAAFFPSGRGLEIT